MFTMKKHDLHMEAYREHWERGYAALQRAMKTFSQTDWDEYRAETREANKHFGIAQGILTRQINAHSR